MASIVSRVVKRATQMNCVPFVWSLARLSVTVSMCVVLGMDKWKMWWTGYCEGLHLLFLFGMTFTAPLQTYLIIQDRESHYPNISGNVVQSSVLLFSSFVLVLN
jgi:hypothetical protein